MNHPEQVFHPLHKIDGRAIFKHNTMIIDFLHTCNTYYEILQFYGVWDYSCPKCHAKHSFHRHGTYERYLVSFDNEMLESTRLEILRLQCSSCGVTHAILTADMVPFLTYSYSCIITLLEKSCGQGKSICRTERETGVPYQTLYRFLLLLREYHAKISLLLRSCHIWNDESNPDILLIPSFLLKQPPPSIQIWFFQKYQSPLLLHRQSTVSYPLLFRARFQRLQMPT